MKFDISCNVPDRWVPQFVGLLSRMQSAGADSKAETLIFYADGFHDFKPTFDLPPTVVPLAAQPTLIQDTGELFFDADAARDYGPSGAPSVARPMAKAPAPAGWRVGVVYPSGNESYHDIDTLAKGQADFVTMASAAVAAGNACVVGLFRLDSDGPFMIKRVAIEESS